mgnify:FL=1
MSRVQPARAYDALYGAFVTRATPTRATRGRLTAHRALAHLSLPNVAFADPVYTVSGARDHYREQARVANATETVPVRENMFAEGANYPAHETRCVRTRRPPNSRIHRSPRDARLICSIFSSSHLNDVSHLAARRSHDDAERARATRSPPARTSRASSARRPPGNGRSRTDSGARRPPRRRAGLSSWPPTKVAHGEAFGRRVGSGDRSRRGPWSV